MAPPQKKTKKTTKTKKPKKNQGNASWQKKSYALAGSGMKNNEFYVHIMFYLHSVFISLFSFDNDNERNRMKVSSLVKNARIKCNTQTHPSVESTRIKLTLESN